MAKPVRQLQGFTFFVTTNLAKRYEKLFLERELAMIVRGCLFDFRSEIEYAVFAWVVMPDHLHAIIGLKGKKTISQVMNRVKGVAARKINFIRRKSGTLWQAGYHDEIIRNEKQMNATIDYIHNNPVAAGLVESADQWEFSSYKDYMEGRMEYPE